MGYRIYLDDVRTPKPETGEWVVVRSYDEFVQKINTLGLENIELISLDHDLGDSAMKEWLYGVTKNYSINYDNITERTGMDCTKWLVEKWLDGAPVVPVMIHSANAVGSANMMGYINNYKHIHRLPQDCVRWNVPHTIETTFK
jgi:5-formaminoimidazole-4-carboxamide-1-beta-D-ribofuranosyl 5'-monophosphate synthetase